MATTHKFRVGDNVVIVKKDTMFCNTFGGAKGRITNVIPICTTGHSVLHRYFMEFDKYYQAKYKKVLGNPLGSHVTEDEIHCCCPIRQQLLLFED